MPLLIEILITTKSGLEIHLNLQAVIHQLLQIKQCLWNSAHPARMIQELEGVVQEVVGFIRWVVRFTDNAMQTIKDRIFFQLNVLG